MNHIHDILSGIKLLAATWFLSLRQSLRDYFLKMRALILNLLAWAVLARRDYFEVADELKIRCDTRVVA